MDLDFSFALVSSLTPRSHYKKTHLVENNDCSSKLQKTKQKLGFSSKSRNTETTTKTIQVEKENKPPKEQLMNRHGKPSKILEKKVCQQDLNNGDDSSLQVSFNMANIAIRKRVKDKRNPRTSLQQSSGNLLNTTSDKIRIEKPLQEQCNTNISSEKLSFHEVRPRSSFGLEICSNNSDECLNQQVKRNPSLQNKFSFSSVSSADIIDSSVTKEECNSNGNKVVTDSNTCELNKRRRSTRISGLSDTTLSTAYDSDSIIKTCKNKVIQETPETDQSVDSSLKRKRVSSGIVLETPETDQSLSFSFIERNKHLKDTSIRNNKKQSSLESNSPDNVAKNDLIDNDHIDLFKEDIQMTVCSELPKKNLRSNGGSSLTNMFKLESSIKNQPFSTKQKEVSDPTRKQVSTTKEKKKLSTSPILKEINKRDSDCTKTMSRVLNSNNTKKSDIKTKNNIESENTCKPVVQEYNDIKKKIRKNTKRNSHNSLTKANISNSSLVLPTEVIPKSDHVRNWLKSTQETSAISISSESSFNSPDTADIKLVGNKLKKPVSLSPRIKKRMKKAKSTLLEEQQLFENLYGSEIVERLSGDVDENISIISFQESVECSEKVLDKLYGTVWQTSHIPQSEPANERKKPKATKKKSPQTERKKRRTSIYDVFSSSSSEDRFEEFLESVQRGKLNPKRRSNLRGTPDFINDSDSDSNCSLAFYQNIVSSAVKEDVNKIRYENTNSISSSKKNRGRRLSFSSSQDGHCSDKGNSDTQNSKKELKPLKKEKKQRGPKSRSKTKADEDVDTKIENDIAIFTLVTPFKVRDKKSGEKTKESVIEPKVPKSVGKSKTPKDKTNSEERLRKKYLGDSDFKVPKQVTTFKTPTKPIKRDVPYSPALSFLSSLSEVTGDLPCHPDAAVFKKNFKSKREELARKLFNLYNKEVFENKLPEDLSIQWNARMTSTSGFCYNKRTYCNNQMFRSSRIVLSTKILDRPVRLRDTLIHELCHAATWILDGTSDGHGRKWKAWAEKSHRRFPELPVIKRCHDYAITTKYTYKCMSCGYCIGRHTKSLDVENKRCGYCFGKFQVFVTTKMSSVTGTSSDQSSNNTRAPRNPTGFALFVKENYATIKKENNVPHAQVMRLLSEKFAKVKLSKLNSDNSGETQ